MSRATEILRTHHQRHPPQRVEAGPCFYCGGPMQKWKQRDGRRMPDDAVTTDHVFPESGRASHPSDAKWVAANMVECCSWCNCHKGVLDPLDYLVIMPDPHGAERLAELLANHLWVEFTEIEAAMARRKK